ncbi:MAG: tetratricopeptide repeat protein [Akkermansiaceae bacterium]
MSDKRSKQKQGGHASDESAKYDSEAAPRRPSSRLRLWCFRLIAALVVPTVFLLLLEGGLRLFGYGESMTFTNVSEVRGKECHVPNPRFAWRYFPRKIAREAIWFSYPVKKDPDTIRVFVLGGSAAQGDPEPSYGLSRMLGRMLERRYPDKDFEVINAAMTAINSHVVRDIAAEIVEHDPDLLVVYMGNNEVVGPYGASNPTIPMSDSLATIRASLWAKGTRIGQLLQSAIGSMAKEPEEQQRWRGMETFLEHAVSADEPQLETVYGHFRSNLKAILDHAENAKVPVLLSTVAVNLNDCAPFASINSSDLTSGELAKWKNHYEQGSASQSEGAYDAALKNFRAAEIIDDSHAELHFRIGQCLLGKQKPDEAREHFIRARDLDTLRFRADSQINEMIRKSAKQSGELVTLVDAEKLLLAQSPNGLTGSELFYEHVHLTFSGNYQLALGMLSQLEQALQSRLGKPQQPIPSEEECKQLLALTEYDRLTVLRLILGRLTRPPFTDQLDHKQQYAELEKNAMEIDGALRQQGFSAGSQMYTKALAATPEDPWLHYRLGFFRVNGSGDFAGAQKSFREANRLGLNTAELWLGMGMARYNMGKTDSAIDAFRRGLKIKPDHWRLLSQLGFALNLKGKTEEAIELCERAVEITPDSDGALANLGNVYLANGRHEKAVEYFEKALELGGESANKLVNVGLTKAAMGKRKESVELYQKALALDANHFRANREMGGIQLEAGKRLDALRYFNRAHASRPGDFATANNLAWLLATVPNPELRDGAKAVQLAQMIAKMTNYRDPSVLDTLAAAYAEAGQFDKAVAVSQKALSLSPSSALASQIRERLRLYQAGKPFHEK